MFDPNFDPYERMLLLESSQAQLEQKLQSLIRHFTAQQQLLGQITEHLRLVTGGISELEQRIIKQERQNETNSKNIG